MNLEKIEELTFYLLEVKQESDLMKQESYELKEKNNLILQRIEKLERGRE